MQYTEVTLTIVPQEPFRDLLMYTLGEEGPYDSFVETADGMKAYVPTHLFDEAWLKEALGTAGCDTRYEVAPLPDKDWNSEWEKTHKPVLVEGLCWVRAPFHEHRADVRYEIEIEPKMSFGTAHHATTYMMLHLLCHEPMDQRVVLDMGCGTGVLAILAAMRGARHVDAIDIDDWAYRNAQENISRNGCADRISCRLGDASSLPSVPTYDVVLANINRNILLADMERYVGAMRPGATLLMSGFYEGDVPALQAHATTLGLTLQAREQRDDWAAIKLGKL